MEDTILNWWSTTALEAMRVTRVDTRMEAVSIMEVEVMTLMRVTQQRTLLPRDTTAVVLIARLDAILWSLV